jgi:hypothetical protein
MLRGGRYTRPMGRLITRADLGFLAIWQALMVPLAVFGPSDGPAAFVLPLGCAVVASLASRRLFGRRRLPACGSTPLWLSFVVGAGVMAVTYEALLLAGAGFGGGTVGIAVGFYVTADSILDRWWLNRGPGPTGTPVTPA